MSINIIETDFKWAYALTPRTITDLLVLHHEAGRGTVESVHNYHLSKGWAGIAYHYFVTLDGTIYRGRPEDMQGGHTKGYNERSIGICAEGNFETETMSDAQREALRALVLDIRSRYPGIDVVRHKDLAATACPGKNYPFDYIAAPEKSAWEKEQEVVTEWVKERGISDGTRPHDPISRVELWAMLYRMEGKKND